MRTTVDKGVSTSVGFYDMAGAGTTFYRESTMYTDKGLTSATTIRTQITTNASGNVVEDKIRYYQNGELYDGNLYAKQLSVDTDSGMFTQVATLKINDGKLESRITQNLLSGKELQQGQTFKIGDKTYIAEKLGNQVVPVSWENSQSVSSLANSKTNILGEKYNIAGDNADSRIQFGQTIDGRTIMRGDVTRDEQKGVLLQNNKGQELLLLNDKGIVVQRSDNSLSILSAIGYTVTENTTGMKQVGVMSGTGQGGGSEKEQNTINARSDKNGIITIEAKQTITIQDNAWVLTEGESLNNVGDNKIAVMQSNNVAFLIGSGQSGEIENGQIKVDLRTQRFNEAQHELEIRAQGDLVTITTAEGKSYTMPKAAAEAFFMRTTEDTGERSTLRKVSDWFFHSTSSVQVTAQDKDSKYGAIVNGNTLQLLESLPKDVVRQGYADITAIRGGVYGENVSAKVGIEQLKTPELATGLGSGYQKITANLGANSTAEFSITYDASEKYVGTQIGTGIMDSNATMMKLVQYVDNFSIRTGEVLSGSASTIFYGALAMVSLGNWDYAMDGLTNSINNVWHTDLTWDEMSWGMIAGAVAALPATLAAVITAPLLLTFAVSAVTAAVSSIAAFATTVIGAITSATGVMGAMAGIGSAFGALSVGVQTHLIAAVVLGGISQLATRTGFYKNLGDEIKAILASGGEVSWGLRTGFEALSVVHTLAGVLLVGGELHEQSKLNNTIIGDFSIGNLVAVTGFAASLVVLGALSVGKSVLQPFKTLWVNKGQLPSQIASQFLKLSGYTVTKNPETQKLMWTFAGDTAKGAWQGLGTSFAYMKSLNAGLWVTGQLAVNYLPDSNPAAQIYQYILSPFTGGSAFNLDTFISDVVIGDWSSNGMLAVFSLGMFVMAPLMSSLSATRASLLGDVGEIELGSGLFGRSSSKLINGIIEEGVKERLAGSVLQSAGVPQWASEYIVEFFFPGSPTVMTTNFSTTTRSISEYQGISETEILAKAGVNTVSDLEIVTGQSNQSIVDYLQVNYHNNLQASDFNALGGDTNLAGLQTMLNFNNDQMSGLISELSGGLGVTLGQINLHGLGADTSLSNLAATLNTEYMNPTVTSDFTLPVLSMISGQSIENILGTFGFSSENIKNLNTELEVTTLSGIASVLGVSMDSLAAKLDLTFTHSNTTLTSRIADIAKFAGKTETQVETVLKDKFNLTAEMITRAQDISHADSFSNVSLGAMAQVLDTTPQQLAKALDIVYNAPIVSNMIDLLQLSRVSGISVLSLIERLDLKNVTLERIAGTDDVENLTTVLNSMEGLGNITAVTTVGEIFSQLEVSFNQASFTGTKTLQGAQVDLANTLDLNLQTIASISGKTTANIAESLNLKLTDSYDIVVTVYQNGVFEYDQETGDILAQVTGDEDFSVFSAANTQKGTLNPLNLRGIFSAMGNAKKFRNANITVKYENGVNLTQFSNVDKLEAEKDEQNNIVISGYLNGKKVQSIGLSSGDTLSKETSSNSIAQAKAERANIANHQEINTDISSLLHPDMVPKGLNVKEDLMWKIDPTNQGGNRIVAQDPGNHAMVKFADELTKVVIAFETVKSRQNMDSLVDGINQIIKTKEDNGIVTVSIDSNQLFGVLKDADWVNNDMILTQDLADSIASNLEKQLSKEDVKQVDADMVYASTGRDHSLKLTQLTDMQRDKFLQFINDPTMGHEIGTGAGKTAYLIHLNAIAGLINGKNKAVIILSDNGKLKEAYSGATKELYDTLLGAGSHMDIDSHVTQNTELLNKVRDPKTKVVFTQTSVFGFMTDAKRVAGSVESKLFNALTNNVQLVQDEIHTIYGQNFIRGKGDDTPLTEEQKVATVAVGDFIKQKSEQLERLGAVIDQKTGYADLSQLTIKTNSRGYDIAPVFVDAFYAELADYLNETKYLGRSDWTQAMLNGNNYSTSEELMHIRSVTKALARFTNEAEGVSWGVFDFGDINQLQDETFGLTKDFQDKALKENRGKQVVPVSFGKLDVTRQFSNPYDAAVKHYFGLAAHAYGENLNKQAGLDAITVNEIKPNLDTVTTTPESTQANYLEFLSIAMKNGSDVSSMTGTYNLIAGMVNALGINVDRSERDELVLKYVDVSKDDLRATVANYLGISEQDLLIKKAGLIANNTQGNEKIFEMADKILSSFGITADEMRQNLADGISNMQGVKGNFSMMKDTVEGLLQAVQGENRGVTLQQLVVAMAEASSFAKAQLQSVNGVGSVSDAFLNSIISQTTETTAYQNYVIVPEAEGLSQPDIKRLLKEHLSEMPNKENFQFVSHDSSDTWTLYTWDGNRNDFIEFEGNLSNGSQIENGVLSLENDVSKMLLDKTPNTQTVILCNVGDVFGLDLKADERTKFIDIMDEGTMLTNAMQGFGRMRGYGAQNAKEFNARSVYMVGNKTGNLNLSDVFQQLIVTENKEVQKITLNVIDDAIKHAGISLLKKMQDQAAGAPTAGANKLLGHAAFAVGNSLVSNGGIILSSYLKAVKEHYDLNKNGGKTEYEIIEEKLLELWNQQGQDQDNSVSTPQETQAYLENRLAEAQKHFEDLLNDKEFTGKLSEANKGVLNDFVNAGKQIFNQNYETEVTFLNESADETQSRMNRKNNLFSLENTYQNIRDLISEKIKRSDLPARAVFGQSESAAVSTSLAQVQDTVFAESDAKQQSDFMKKEGLLRSDNTLTKTGKSYVNDLYKKLNELSPKEQNMILAAIPAMAIPPEEKKQTGVIAIALIDGGYVEFGQLDKDTVAKLVNLAYAINLFGDSLSDKAKLELQDPKTVKQLTTGSAVSLQKYFMTNVSTLPEQARDIFKNISQQIALKDEINVLYQAVYVDKTTNKIQLKSLINQMGKKRNQLEKLQNAIPVTMGVIGVLADSFASNKNKNDAMYQIARIFVEPNLSVEKFETAIKINTVLDSIGLPLTMNMQVSDLIHAYSMDKKERETLIESLVGAEDIESFNDNIKNLQALRGKADRQDTSEAILGLIDTLKGKLSKVNTETQLTIINWLAGTNFTEADYNEMNAANNPSIENCSLVINAKDANPGQIALAHYQIAEIQFAAKELDKAEKSYKELIIAATGNGNLKKFVSGANVGLGNISMIRYSDSKNQEDLDSAKAYFEEALIADSNSAPAYYNLGRVNLVEEDYIEAIDNLGISILLAKNDPNYKDMVAMAATMKNQAIDAVGLNDIQAVSIENAQLGYANIKKEKFEEAINNFKRAIALTNQLEERGIPASKLDSQASQLHEALGTALANKAEQKNDESLFDQAAEQYKLAISRNDQNSQAHYFLGILNANKGDWDKATEEFDAVERTAGSNENLKQKAKINKEKISELRNQQDKMMTLKQRAIDVMAALDLVVNDLNEGNIDNAKAKLGTIIADAKNEGPINAIIVSKLGQLGNALIEAKQFDKAVIVFDSLAQAADNMPKNGAIFKDESVLKEEIGQLKQKAKFGLVMQKVTNGIENFEQGEKQLTIPEAQVFYAKAAKEFQSSIDIAGNIADNSGLQFVVAAAIFNKALSLLQAGDTEQSAKGFEEFRQVMSKHELGAKSAQLADRLIKSNDIITLIEVEEIRKIANSNDANKGDQMGKAFAIDENGRSYQIPVIGEKKGNTLEMSSMWEKDGSKITIPITAELKALDIITKDIKKAAKDLPEEQRIIVNEIISFAEDKGINLLASNAANVMGFANGKGEIFVSEKLAEHKNPLVRGMAVFHEAGEAYFNKNQGLLPIGVSSHTYLRGCGKDVRNVMPRAIASLTNKLAVQNRDISSAESTELVEEINILLGDKRVTSSEMALMDDNCLKGKNIENWDKGLGDALSKDGMGQLTDALREIKDENINTFSRADVRSDKLPNPEFDKELLKTIDVDPSVKSMEALMMLAELLDGKLAEQKQGVNSMLNTVQRFQKAADML
ncbi:MAG: tetratricopeptide repeat protein [Candidatus Omnitrophota bacterium]